MQFGYTLILVIFGNFVYLPMARDRKNIVLSYKVVLSVCLALLALGFIWHQIAKIAELVSFTAIVVFMYVVKLGILSTRNEFDKKDKISENKIKMAKSGGFERGGPN